MERALAVARAFDAHPVLRPRKVGGDPARITVDPSLEAVVSTHGLPISWLTFRETKPDFEMGSVDLQHGRGGAAGTKNEDGAIQWELISHSVVQEWGRTVTHDPGLVREVAELFEELVLTLDAAWGAIAVDQRLSAGPEVWKKLPGVFWINYFGPAFRAKYPMLVQLPRARVTSNGGVLVRTTPQSASDLTSSPVATTIRDAFGAHAFEFANRNPALPSVEDQLAAAPGPEEMPWVAWERARAERSREKRHASARKRLHTLLAARPAPEPSDAAVEWSTSLDIDVWKPLFSYVKRRVRGEMTSPLGAALFAVIATAPIDEQDSVTLTTALGVVQLGWFIDDVDTVTVTFVGPEEIARLWESWFETD